MVDTSRESFDTCSKSFNPLFDSVQSSELVSLQVILHLILVTSASELVCLQVSWSVCKWIIQSFTRFWSPLHVSWSVLQVNCPVFHLILVTPLQVRWSALQVKRSMRTCVSQPLPSVTSWTLQRSGSYLRFQLCWSMPSLWGALLYALNKLASSFSESGPCTKWWVYSLSTSDTCSRNSHDFRWWSLRERFFDFGIHGNGCIGLTTNQSTKGSERALCTGNLTATKTFAAKLESRRGLVHVQIEAGEKIKLPQSIANKSALGAIGLCPHSVLDAASTSTASLSDKAHAVDVMLLLSVLDTYFSWRPTAKGQYFGTLVPYLK